MQAKITGDGTLVFYADNETEIFAIDRWVGLVDQMGVEGFVKTLTSESYEPIITDDEDE